MGKTLKITDIEDDEIEQIRCNLREKIKRFHVVNDTKNQTQRVYIHLKNPSTQPGNIAEHNENT